MRILFVSHYFPPETNAPAVRTYENCRRWAEMGHEVTVITGAPNHPDGVLQPGYQNRWLNREEVDGIRVIRRNRLKVGIAAGGKRHRPPGCFAHFGGGRRAEDDRPSPVLSAVLPRRPPVRCPGRLRHLTSVC